MGKLKILNFGLWSVFLFLVCFSFASNPFVNLSLGDSAIFSYIGERWAEGFVPYRDYFDHKGPMIFLINVFARSIGDGFLGLWIAECVFAFLSILVIYWFMRKHFKSVDPLYIEFPIAGLVWWCFSGGGGNMNEEYAFLFIVVVLLDLYNRILLVKSVSKQSAFLYGCAFMSVFLFKANLVVFAFVIALFFLNDLYATRDWKSFVIRSLMVLAGMLAVLLPFVIYFYANNALYDMWYASIVFNLKYASQPWQWTWTFLFVFIVFAVNIAQLVKEEDSRIAKSLKYNLIFLGLSLLVLSKQPFFDHYFVMTVPGFVLPLAVLFDKARSKKWLGYTIVIFSGMVLVKTLFCSNFDVGAYVAYVKSGGSVIDWFRFKEGHQMEELKAFKPYIQDSRSVFVYGEYSQIYQYLNISGAYKYFAHTVGLVPSLDSNINDALLEHINQKKDRYIIICKRSAKPYVEEQIKQCYNLCCELDDYILFERQNDETVNK